MGIFTKMVNYMTGGSAEVSVDVPNAQLNHPFEVNVLAVVKEDALQINGVYLKIRCQEAKLDGYRPENEIVTDNEKILSEMNEWVYKTLFETNVNVAEAQQLESGKSYEWKCELDLTEADHVSFESPGEKIIWQLQAGIDVHGNDPDSGWLDFVIS